MSCSLIQIIRRQRDRSGGLRQRGIESDPQAYARRPPGVEFPGAGVSVSHPGYLQSTGPGKESASNNYLRAFTLPELKSATKNFSVHNQLGEGGFGLVYKGTIKQPKSKFSDSEEKVEVAIKQLNNAGLQGHHEWVTEVHFLGMVDNPYLVKLIGYCADDDERGIQRLLVYEYMPNKGLDDHLFRTAAPLLSWQTRIQVALGAAQGLAYLHDDKGVIFRDFKTANILLDEGFNPKLSDFGLARQGPDAGKTHVTTGVKGTYGYAAPEYMQTGHLTFKSDVFSFGVVLLEILTGRRAMDQNRPRLEQRLLEWVKPFINDPRKFHLAVDPRLETNYPTKAAMKFATIAIQCLVKQPRARPKMNDIVEGLKKVLEMTHQWENPTSITASTPAQIIDNKVSRQTTHPNPNPNPNPNPKLPRQGPNPKPIPAAAPWERSNAPAFPLPAIESSPSAPTNSEELSGAKSPRHDPRGTRRPAAQDPLLAMERIHQFPLPAMESSAMNSEEAGAKSPLRDPRGARRPAARDPSLAMERINQMPVYYGPSTPERNVESRNGVRSVRSIHMRSGMDNRYLTPA